MALEKSYTTDGGVSLSEAYHKISTMRFRHWDENPKVDIIVDIYRDSTARVDLTRVVYVSYTCDGSDYTTYFSNAALDVENQNIRERAYTWLKTLEDYSGASDV